MLNVNKKAILTLFPDTSIPTRVEGLCNYSPELFSIPALRFRIGVLNCGYNSWPPVQRVLIEVSWFDLFQASARRADKRNKRYRFRTLMFIALGVYST